MKIADVALFKKIKDLRAGQAVFAMASIQNNPR